MSWETIALADIRDAGRSWSFWGLAVLLAGSFVGVVGVVAYLGQTEFTAALGGLVELVSLFVPLVALLLGYRAVAGKRSRGSIYLSLSFPASRRDLAVGTFVGRTVILLVPTLGGLLLAGVAAAVVFGTEGLLMYPWFLLVTALYGAAFVGIAVGLSMATTADRWLTLGALGGYLVLVQLWNALVTIVVLVLHRGPPAEPPEWSLLAGLAQPPVAFDRLLGLGGDLSPSAPGAVTSLDWWLALLVLVLWTVVPLTIGYRRFVASEL